MCLYSLHVGSINSKPNLHWCGGEESLELEKARGDLLGERAMAEAVGWVGGISHCPYYASRHLVLIKRRIIANNFECKAS